MKKDQITEFQIQDEATNTVYTFSCQGVYVAGGCLIEGIPYEVVWPTIGKRSGNPDFSAEPTVTFIEEESRPTGWDRWPTPIKTEKAELQAA